MTEHQIELVKNSWKILSKVDPELIGDVFYSKLFIEMPQVRPLFKTPRATQSRKLIATLSIIVNRLDELEILTKDIEELAIRHVKYGVRPEHYSVVGSALFWTLERGLGIDWNSEVAEAWHTCYTTLSQTMIRAAYPAKNISSFL